ncbi:hypothetical protein Aph01nite_02630 [Acrocarpospora phusangensis]|uniref:AMIN-like domain-containing protein n=1 Tax=Acrocarpospora phusangensis TaxID=1070424 RepID=A0A919Q4V4_9ACTN|nr:hypothetical protein [Acrocarpospora phusangensis]GIH21953.1 hypothetical protein Aph01nite_02630 [Acrocarpospora phusangensis]
MKLRALLVALVAAGATFGVAAQPVAAAPKPFSKKEVTVTRAWNAPATVAGVRYARHKGYDRVVVDLKGPFPGYTIRWVKKLISDGSGMPYNVKGKAFLEVRLGWARAHTDAGKPTWAGGPIYKADLGNLTRVVRTGDYEGYVTIGLALKKKAGFRVLEQKQPDRIVIDVAH